MPKHSLVHIVCMLCRIVYVGVYETQRVIASSRPLNHFKAEADFSWPADAMLIRRIHGHAEPRGVTSAGERG